MTSIQHDTVTAMGMDGYTAKGSWSQLDTMTINTLFKKHSDSQKVSVTSDSADEVKATIMSDLPLRLTFGAASHTFMKRSYPCS